MANKFFNACIVVKGAIVLRVTPRTPFCELAHVRCGGKAALFVKSKNRFKRNKVSLRQWRETGMVSFRQDRAGRTV